LRDTLPAKTSLARPAGCVQGVVGLAADPGLAGLRGNIGAPKTDKGLARAYARCKAETVRVTLKTDSRSGQNAPDKAGGRLLDFRDLY